MHREDGQQSSSNSVDMICATATLMCAMNQGLVELLFRLCIVLILLLLLIIRGQAMDIRYHDKISDGESYCIKSSVYVEIGLSVAKFEVPSMSCYHPVKMEKRRITIVP